MTIPGARAVVPMVFLLAGVAGGFTRVEARVRLAQGRVPLPRAAPLNRRAREAITTPPLDVSEPPPGVEPGAQERHRDRRDRRIDRRSPQRGGSCDDC